MTTSERTSGLVGNFTEARLAWAIGVPIYAVLAIALQTPGYAAFTALAGDGAQGSLLSATGAAVAITNITIATFGLALATHTVGMTVSKRTLDAPNATAVRAFALMGAALSLLPAAYITWGSGHPGAGAVFAFIAIVVPSTITAALTRALLPRVVASRALARAVIALAVVVGVVLIGWLVAIAF